MNRLTLWRLFVATLSLVLVADLKAALQFDGVDDGIAALRSWNYQSDSVTVEGWFKTSQSSVGRIVTQPVGDLQSFSLLVNATPGRVEARFDSSDGSGPVVAVSQSTVTDGAWHHVAGVFNASSERLILFVDGALETSVMTPKKPLSSNRVPNIGYFDASIGQYFHGELDEVRIWKRALSGAEIRTNRYLRRFDSAKDMIVPWSFDLTMLHPDIPPNSGPVVTSGLRLPTDAIGEAHSNNNSVNDYSEVPHIVEHASPSFTIEAWFRIGARSEPQRIVTKPDDSLERQRYSLVANVEPGTVEFRIDPRVNIDGAWVARSTSKVNDSRWHHVAGVYDSSAKQIRLYVDGVIEAERSVFGGPAGSIQPVFIGRFSSQITQSLFGDVDEVRLWDRARTSGEIYNTYAKTLQGNEAGLVGYYPFLPNPQDDRLIDLSPLQNHGINRSGQSGASAIEPRENQGVAIQGLSVFDEGTRVPNLGNDPWLAVDGKATTGNSLAPGNTTSPQIVAFDLGDAPVFVNRLRVAKHGSIDAGPFAQMNLRILFSTDTGPLESRQYAPVAGLTNGFKGRELIQAERVSRAGVFRENHDFESNGFYSLTFFDVNATAIAIRVERDREDSQPWSHYRPLEVQLYRETEGIPVKLEKALAFDGTNDYMTIPRFPTGSDQSITVETWVKSSGSGALGRLVTRPSDDQSKQQFSLFLHGDGVPEFRVDTTEGAIFAKGTGPVTDGNWHHLAGVFNDATDRLSLFVDGVLVNSVPINRAPLSTSQSIQVGRFSSKFDQFFKGVIDEIRIWNVARSAIDIQVSSRVLLTGAEPGLVGYFPLNEGSGDSAGDVSPLDNTATLFNLPIWTDSNRADPLTPPNRFTISELLSLTTIERAAPITTVTGIGGAELVLKNLKGTPPISVKPTQSGQEDGGGSLIWASLPFPVQSARVLQNPPRLALQCFLSLPGFSDVEGKPMQEGIELLVDAQGNVEISGGKISIPKTFVIKKLAVSDIQFEYLASEKAFGGGLLMGWGNPKIVDLCGRGTKGPRRIGGSFRVRDGKLQKITLGAKAIRRALGTSGAFLDEASVTVDGLDTDNYSFGGRIKVNVGCPVIRRKSKNGDTVFVFPASAEAKGRIFPTTTRIEIEGGVKLVGFDSLSGSMVYEPPYKISGDAKVNFLFGVYVAEAKYAADANGFSGSTKGTFTLPQDLGVFARRNIRPLAADGAGTVLPDVQATIDGNGNLKGSFQLSKSIGERSCSQSCSEVCENSVVNWLANVLKVSCRNVCDTTCNTVNKVLSAKVAFTIGDSVGFEVQRKSLSGVEVPSGWTYPQYYDEESGTTLTLFTNWDPLVPSHSGGALQRLNRFESDNQSNTTFEVPEGAPAAIIQVLYENYPAEGLDVTLVLPDGTTREIEEGALPEGFADGQGFATVTPALGAATFYVFEPAAGEYQVQVENGASMGEFSVVGAVQDPEPYVDVIDVFFDEEDPDLFIVAFDSGDLDGTPENRFLLTEDPESELGTEIFPLALEEEDGVTLALFDLQQIEVAPGDYHVLVTADDGRNARVSDYSEFTVYVEDPNAPQPVTVLRSRSQKNGFTVEWDPAPGDDIEHYTVLYTRDDDISGIQSAETTSRDSLSKTVFGLENGTPYLITVVSVNNEGFHSEVAAVHRVIPTEGLGLNPPVIVSDPFEFATAGFPYLYVPHLFDADTVVPAGDHAPNEMPAEPLQLIEANNRWQLTSAPPGMIIDENSGAVFWEPTEEQVGSHEVSIRVSEPDLSAFGLLGVPQSTRQSFVLRVLPNDNLNGLEEHPFEFWSQPVLNVRGGDQYRYPVTVLGAPAGSYLLEMLEGAEGMELTEDNVLVWDVPEQAESPYVWLRASIPFGEFLVEIDQEFLLHVQHSENQLEPLTEITRVVVDGDELLIRWTGNASTYEIQARNSLDAGSWLPLGEVTTEGAIHSWRTPIGAGEFIRVVALNESE